MTPTLSDRIAQLLLDAPLDDEPLTPEDEAALAEAHEDLAAGRVYSSAEVRRMIERGDQP